MKKLREDYNLVVRKIKNKQYNKSLVTQVGQSKKNAEEFRANFSNSKNKGKEEQELKECNYYIAKYEVMVEVIKEKKSKSITSQEFINLVNPLFQPYVTQADNKQSTIEVKDKTNLGGVAEKDVEASSKVSVKLSEFFKKKESEIKERIAEESKLESHSISPSRFKKREKNSESSLRKTKIGEQKKEKQTEQTEQQKKKANSEKRRKQEEQEKAIKRENQEMKKRIHEETSRKKDLTLKVSENEVKIKSLEEERSKLLNANMSLLEQQSLSHRPQIQKSDQKAFEPAQIQEGNGFYVLQTRVNDLYIINAKNYSDNESTNRDIEFGNTNHLAHNSFHYQFEDYSIQDEVQKNQLPNFTIFQDPKWQELSFDNKSSDGQNRELGLNNRKILHRNKLAFFSEKGILVKQRDIQIGFKRSSPKCQNTLKIILYVYNKGESNKNIHLQYKYQPNYYQVMTQERIQHVDAKQQARQVIIVRLRQEAKDFNSIIDAYLHVGTMKYNLWLPAMFIDFENVGSFAEEQVKVQTKIIYPINQFRSYQLTKKLINRIKKIQQNEAELYCVSVLGNGSVHLSWENSNSKLKVRGSEKWLYFLSFLIHESS